MTRDKRIAAERLALAAREYHEARIRYLSAMKECEKQLYNMDQTALLRKQAS